MALLSGVMRTAAITGSTDSFHARIAGRQGAQWAERTVRAALPRVHPPGTTAAARPAADRSETLRQLAALRERGILTDGEFERLLGRLGG